VPSAGPVEDGKPVLGPADSDHSSVGVGRRGEFAVRGGSPVENRADRYVRANGERELITRHRNTGISRRGSRLAGRASIQPSLVPGVEGVVDQASQHGHEVRGLHLVGSTSLTGPSSVSGASRSPARCSAARLSLAIRTGATAASAVRGPAWLRHCTWAEPFRRPARAQGAAAAAAGTSSGRTDRPPASAKVTATPASSPARTGPVRSGPGRLPGQGLSAGRRRRCSGPDGLAMAGREQR
jgi:hypothetical protein